MSRRLWIWSLVLLMLVACSPAKPSRAPVVYYSLNDQIDSIAGIVAEELNADLFEIETDRDFEKLLDHEPLDAAQIGELRSDDFKLKQPVPDDWNTYSVVYFGFPVWYGEPAQPSQLFLMQNNLKGKTWFPFTIGSRQEAQDMLQFLNSYGLREGWHDPKGFSETPSRSEIRSWIDETRADLQAAADS